MPKYLNKNSEKLFRELIFTISSTLDIKKIKKLITSSLGKAINLDRCFIIEYDPIEDKFLPVDNYSEYRSSKNIKTVTGFNFSKKELSIFKEIALNTSEVYEISSENDLFKKFNKDFIINSCFLVSIFFSNQFLGIIVGQNIKESHKYSTEEKNFIKAIAAQSAIALNQSRLYQAEKLAVEREKLIADISKKSINSFDINQIKQLVKEVGEFTKADRCYFFEFDSEKIKIKPVDSNGEYLASSGIKSIIGYEFPIEYEKKFILRYLKNNKNIVVIDYEEFKKKNNNTEFINYGNIFNLKSCIVIPFYYLDKLIAVITIEYINKKVLPNNDELNFLITLKNQIGIAYNQIQLYTKEKQTAEREALLGRVIKTIRSSLDINEIKKNVVNEIGKAFAADRCYFRSVNKKTNLFLPPDVEYLASEDIKSLLNTESDQEGLNFFFEEAVKEKDILPVIVTRNIIKEKHLEKTPLESYFNNSDIKADYAIPIWDRKEELTFLVLHYVKKEIELSREDKELLTTLAKQILIAIEQASLYESVKKTAEREALLREIISQLKLTRDLDEAYNRLLQQIAKIFKLNRVLFLESSITNPDKLNIKYEYVKDREKLSEENPIFSQICKNEFLSIIHLLETLIINDVAECYTENTFDYFEKYKIKSLLGVPLVKYNQETKVLGFIILCGEETRIWTSDEIDLINAISNSVVSIIWEITKFIEIEDLRNAFVTTLAHDFQVPLVGEKVALEFLLDHSDIDFGKNREILEEILENNQNITILLNKSVEIYNYESKKKKPDFEIYEIKDILNETIETLKNYANSKSVKIIFNNTKKPVFVNVDRTEIMKVFHTVIENAIDHSTTGEIVEIKHYKQGNRIIISIYNTRESISLEIQQRIFKRYEMALTIERKIGSGTGLFLAKLILESHKGSIWFETKGDKGTTFFISLPISEDKKIEPF